MVLGKTVILKFSKNCREDWKGPKEGWPFFWLYRYNKVNLKICQKQLIVSFCRKIKSGGVFANEIVVTDFRL